MGISKCTRSSGIGDFQQNEWRNNHNSLTTSLIPENEDKTKTEANFNIERERERRISKAPTPIPGRFKEEWAKLDMAPTTMRGKAVLQEAALIVTNVRPELAITR